ncbi:peptide chain release factor N(5)-glutamine methyltransferase [Paucihalobacter ruber]|uniref:Release factor glutamine methyltransferase n=1 Tax=Paucihalobacter ruber TaxID=2567861 RepID=A0A506PFA8_9FLAO|nr:peptide chain release factor N(5)-glutamine methyltransferase [Paucihalobacter ruber]TPV32279.1 peptide chain release factor N(5)-glutamine methyltransferase [Paucihalobacter ruber]
MTLAALQEKFHSELSSVYDQNEVDAIFYSLADHFLQYNRLNVSINKSIELSESNSQLFSEVIERLQQHEPVQYITGVAHFYGLIFKVNQHTLIPRPETEELVDWAIKLMDKPKTNLKILDIGTGSGCIAVSLAKYLKQSKVYAIDISDQALNVARENAKLSQVDVEFVKADVFNLDFNAELFQNQFDLIISNPPYVRELEKVEMKPNVLNFEPSLALFVPDSDALRFYEAIVKLSLQNLKSGGLLIMEINQYLSKEMLHLIEIYNFELIEFKKDLFGNFRMIKAVKP